MHGKETFQKPTWTHAIKIQNIQKRNKALKRLKTIITERFNLQMLPSQHLKFLHHKEFPLKKLKEWLSNILAQIYCKDTLKCIKTITNVVTLNRPSIKSIL